MAHACHICNFYPVPDGEGAECPHCHRLQYGNVCPNCHQSAPTILRGMSVVCSACNTVRGPLTAAMPLNIVGKPSKVGSVVTRVAGWGVLLGTFVVTAMIALLMGVIFGAGPALVAALVLGGAGALVGTLMLRGSRALEQRGESARRDARDSAIFALAANRGGTLTAQDVATALNVQLSEADAALTALAREGTRVTVDVDPAGVVHYVFLDVRPAGSAAARAPTGVRVDVGAPAGVRVDASGQPEDERARIREQVDREFEQMQRMQAAKTS